MNLDNDAKLNILQANGLEPEDKGKYFLLRCPDCGHKEMYLYKGSSNMVCNRRNRCGAVINFWDFLKQTAQNVNKAVVESIIEADKKHKKELDKLFPEDVDIELPEEYTLFATNPTGLIANQALSYLKNRNIPEKNILKLGYIFDPQSMFNRTIFIPFYEDGKIVYFITRDWTGKRKFRTPDGEVKEIRYLNPKGVDASRFLYNYDEIQEGEDLFIFEGVFDALSLENQVGTAYIKAHLSDTQASKIWERMPGRVIFVPDTDKTGQTVLRRNYKTIMRNKPPSLNTEILVYDIIGAKDFNESGLHHINIEECYPFKQSVFKALNWTKIKSTAI